MKARYADIYRDEAARYDALVSCEDHEGRLLPALRGVARLEGATVVEMGAGTGRLTALVAPEACRVVALDRAHAMLRRAAARELGGHVSFAVADHRALPLPAACADVVIEGWAFGHLLDEGLHAAAAATDEAERVSRPGGVVVLLETLGTGRTEPAPPSPALARFFEWLESARGYRRRWVRTDYRFESVAEAVASCRFFFGDRLAEQVAASGSPIVPECTGLWSRRAPAPPQR